MLNTICGRYALTEQKRELTLVKELVRAMRLANPGVRALQVCLALSTDKMFASLGARALDVNLTKLQRNKLFLQISV